MYRKSESFSLLVEVFLQSFVFLLGQSHETAVLRGGDAFDVHRIVEEAEYAYMASKEAFGNAGIDETFLQNNEVGIIFGNDSSAKPVIEAANIMAEKHDSALLGSGLIFQSMNSTVNMNLSSIFHLRGINFTV